MFKLELPPPSSFSGLKPNFSTRVFNNLWLAFITVITSIGLYGQPIHPAVTSDRLMPGGTYAEVENTGADQVMCLTCPEKVAHAYCWDGDRPGIATWVPGSVIGEEIAMLPPGAHDPDIVYGFKGTVGMVVYRLDGDIMYQTFTNAVGGGALSLNPIPVLLHTDGDHPNIDKKHDCIGEALDVVVVFTNYNTSVAGDILYTKGVFSGSFGAKKMIDDRAAGFLSRKYVNRMNPDVCWIVTLNSDYLLFTAPGIHVPTNTWQVDVFQRSSPMPSVLMNAPITAGPVIIGAQGSDMVRPRIDGFSDLTGLAHAYAVTYADDNKVYHAFQSSSWNVISPFNTTNELPAIAYNGENHDVIWSSDGNGAMLDILGRGHIGSTIEPNFKEGNSILGSFTKHYPSIAGLCNSTYAMCWWGSDNNMYHKKAIGGAAPNYKKGNNGAGGLSAVLPDVITSEGLAMLESVNTQVEISLYNLAGVLVLNKPLSQLNTMPSLSKGVYLAQIKNVVTGELASKKVWLQ